jgi:putative hydrolase of the HAD superfamily
MSASKVLLFDLGGVLVDFAGFEQLGALVPPPAGPEEIRSRWLDSPAVRDFELGGIAPDEFAERFVAEWRLPLAPAEFLASFAGWPRGLFPAVQALLEALGRRHRIACLSNTHALHWERLRPSLGPLVESAFVSHELGLAKPGRAIFELAVGRLGVRPDEVLFFDDAKSNVEAAAEVGLRAELVRGAVELRRRLLELELLVRPVSGRIAEEPRR